MNLLFFIADMGGGGAQRVMANITNEFARLGHNVSIVSNIKGCSYDIDSKVKILYPQRRDAKGRESILTKYKRNFFNIRNYWCPIKK